MITVLCWFWRQPGGRAQYTAFHVNIWAAMVRRHLAMPHRIACVTDLTEGLDPSIEIITPPRDFEDWRIPSWGPDKPQCLRRIAMFAPNAAKTFGDRFVCMDLDSVISGPLDPLFETEAGFKIFNGTGGGRFYNGSMMMIRAGARPEVYERFTLEGAIEAGRHHVGSDQAWIAHCLGADEETWGDADGVHWWKSRNGRSGAETRVMFFPGGTKPWTEDHPYIRQHYRGDDARRCLILGYAPTVWEEAESALKSGEFDVVIASPEAAAQWPGEVFATVTSDRDADDLAAMHGFREVVVCGRSERVAA